MILEDVIEKSAFARPGYALAAFKESALPVYVITARVITLEKKPLSPIEEGCLRAVEAGLSSPRDIGSFLGLPIQVLKGVIAGLNSREQINYIRSTGQTEAKILMTDKGRTVLNHSKTITPEERLVRFVYDPLLKKVVFIPTTALFRPKEVKERGWLEIPLCGLKRPEVSDIPLPDIDRAVQRVRRAKDEVRELLAVRRIERRELQFTPATALYYRSNSNKEVQVAFFREDGFSVGHETAFAGLGGPELVGANHVLRSPEIPELIRGVASTERTLADLSEIDALERTIAAAELPPTGVVSDNDTVKQEVDRAAEEARARLKAMTQRPVRCHEHPKLLREALAKTQERLLIISPWIRAQVVNEAFLRSLEELLRNRVQIYIGYGLSEGDAGPGKDKARQKQPISPQAQKELGKLQKRFDNFTLKFVGNTHRKMLVSDTRFSIVTSFNWLSFKGDPKDQARDEFGLLVSEPGMLEKIFNDGMALIKEGYDHPPETYGGGAKPLADRDARR